MTFEQYLQFRAMEMAIGLAIGLVLTLAYVAYIEIKDRK